MPQISVKKGGIVKKRILYILYLFAVILILLEIGLRIHYPFPTKIRGDKLELRTNLRYNIVNDFSKRLDTHILHERNSIGFRGPNPPANMENRLSILTIGGSTTACSYLSEGKTWPDRLAQKLSAKTPSVWLNNAGLDGHSSFGHLNLLHYYLPTLSFKPKIILFLMGANDVGRHDLESYDPVLNDEFSYKIKKWLKANSEVVNLFFDLKNALSKPIDESHTDRTNWDFASFTPAYFSKSHIDSAVKSQDAILPAFKKRLYKIIEICAQNNIQPVFITQPLVYGDGSTMAGNIKIDYHPVNREENGQIFWLKLQPFNETIKAVALEKHIQSIDLATLMPKDTLYYYDMVHFNNAGAEKVSEILFEELEGKGGDL